MIKQAWAFNIGTFYKVKFTDPGHLVSTLIANAYAVAALIFLILIIIGGWGMIVGAGSGDSGKVQQGGKAIGAALLGFILIILSYFIVRAIEVITGASIINSGL
ncbi:MAG: hypothetical protein ABIB61_04515 [Candidatus Shapirobacteria bacterium]